MVISAEPVHPAGSTTPDPGRTIGGVVGPVAVDDGVPGLLAGVVVVDPVPEAVSVAGVGAVGPVGAVSDTGGRPDPETAAPGSPVSPELVIRTSVTDTASAATSAPTTSSVIHRGLTLVEATPPVSG
jgi:hypothetical protein